MHPEHRRLLQQLQAAARPDRHAGFDFGGYSGSPHASLGLSVPDRRRIAKHWLAEHKAMPATAFTAVMDSLFEGSTHEEKTMAALLVALDKAARRQLSPSHVDRWLGHLVGWAEVDSLCQNAFAAEDMLADWPAWSALIGRLAGDANINKRRASLVLLTGPDRYSDDHRFVGLAIANIERLKGERDILITKAVSWLLRSLSIRHRDLVEAYLRDKEASLPRIAVRETRAKLQTGRKSPA
jgi:3-methyladenine DNA glycosylase AlkD